MDWITSPEAWVGLLTLLSLEIVLGIDNVVFISILADKLPASQRARARQVGISLAVITRILLLLSISWIVGLTSTLFSIGSQDFSGRDLVLIVGGFFLVGKATHEIHAKLEGAEEGTVERTAASFNGVIIQIVLLDIVFSLDSVITAVGIVEEIAVMVIAVLLAAGIMLTFAGKVSDVVHRHPTLKMLGLSFLLLIGLTLIADGFGQHIGKGYVYSAMGFSLLVEILNLRARRRSHPIELHESSLQPDGAVRQRTTEKEAPAHGGN
jgi:predicted tellurium resistance membrane protein TerC